jgi:hypothetical protein
LPPTSGNPVLKVRFVVAHLIQHRGGRRARWAIGLQPDPEFVDLAQYGHSLAALGLPQYGVICVGYIPDAALELQLP